MNDEVFSLGDPAYGAIYAEEAANIDAAERIAVALERRGMTRTELAHKLGVDQAEVTRRLKGEHNIGIATLAATLHALGERLDLYSTGRGSISNAPDAS